MKDSCKFVNKTLCLEVIKSRPLGSIRNKLVLVNGSSVPTGIAGTAEPGGLGGL